VHRHVPCGLRPGQLQEQPNVSGTLRFFDILGLLCQFRLSSLAARYHGGARKPLQP
jgi:hypothetical protein